MNSLYKTIKTLNPLYLHMNDVKADYDTDAPVFIEDETEYESITSEGVVLVDFYADWCGPCKMLEPIVERLAAETDATIAKVDVDSHQELAIEYRIQGVPTMFLYVDGEPVKRIVGLRGEHELRELIEQYTG